MLPTRNRPNLTPKDKRWIWGCQS